MFTLLLLHLGLSLAASPQRPPPPPPRLEETFDAIDLSDESRAAVDAILEDARPELEQLHRALRQREGELVDDVRAAMTPSERAAFDEALPPRPPQRDRGGEPR